MFVVSITAFRELQIIVKKNSKVYVKQWTIKPTIKNFRQMYPCRLIVKMGLTIQSENNYYFHYVYFLNY